MKTNLNISAMKNLVVIAVLFAAVSANAQMNELLALNSTKKITKAENRLAVLTNKMEKNVRFEAPVVEEEEAGVAGIAPQSLENVIELRSWIKENFEKEALNGNFEGAGSTTLTFIIDKNGKVKNVEISNEDTQIKSLLTNLMKRAPAVKPLEMNGYKAKQYIRVPLYYKIEVM